MNFKKEQLKEVTTIDKVTDIVIFEKGDSTPKRIKSNGNLKCKTYFALLSQGGTDGPSNIEVDNNIGNIVYSYISSGVYRATSNGLFTIGKTYHNISQTDSTANFTSVHLSTDVIEILTVDSSTQTGTDSLLGSTPFKIEIYS